MKKGVSGAARVDWRGLDVPEPPPAAGSYAPVVESGSLAFVSGQLPVRGGKLRFSGRVSDSNVDEARESARLCALNVLAQLGAGPGLGRVSRVVRLAGYVNCGPDFEGHPRVIDAASDLVSGAFGAHARAAVGVSSLPMGAMTELEAVAELRPPLSGR